MRKFVSTMILAVAVLAAALAPAAGQDAFDFGDMPPLPPPLLDDTPPAPLPVPAAGDGGGVAPAGIPPLAPPPAAGTSVVTAPPPLAPPAGTSLLTTPLTPPPLAPPSAPPLAAPLPDAITAPPPAVAGVPAPPTPETPRSAKISGGRVNVRAGPNTQYESVAVLTTGSPITVLARHGEWYKIIYPADQLASIHKNYVNADIAGEIPEAGLPGIVSQDNADVHAFYWDKSTVVGQLNKGDPVTIKQERGQWYRIAAPPSARAYVFAEYIRVDGNETVAADSAPAPINPAVDLSAGTPDATGRLKLSDSDKRLVELKENYFRQLAERQAREEEQELQSLSRLEEALNELDARLQAIDQETGSLMGYSAATTDIGSAAWAPPDPVYGGYTGWVENIGRVGGAPASFRLAKGGEIRFYLRSDKFSLHDFAGRRVWLNGNVELASGAAANVVNVDEIRILTDMEIAEGMRQYAESTGVTAQAVDGSGQLYSPAPADPYAASAYQPAPAAPLGGFIQSAAPVPADASELPDVVGADGIGGGFIDSGLTGSPGEVMTDYYEAPAFSEIAP